MAEFVQQRLEELLPELEQLERVQLFTAAEIRAVIKKRQEFEYRLQRQVKAVEDYTRYIDYEYAFLRLIWKRRHRNGYQHLRAEIDQRIMARIGQLYRVACIRFRDNVEIFLAHAAYCRDTNQLAQGSRVYARLLRHHGGSRPDLWLAAARYELRECANVAACRALLLQAVRLHPGHVPLWCGYVRLELEYVQLLRKRLKLLTGCEDDIGGGGGGGGKSGLKVIGGGLSDSEDNNDGGDGDNDKKAKVVGDGDDGASEHGSEGSSAEALPVETGGDTDPVLDCAIVEAVIGEAVARVPEADGRVSACQVVTAALAVCAEFACAAGLYTRLLHSLLGSEDTSAAAAAGGGGHYCSDPLAHDTVARAALRHSPAATAAAAAVGDGSDAKVRRLQQRLDQCCQVYERGLTQVENESQLYALYLSSLVETLRAAPRHRRMVAVRLWRVYCRARHSASLTLDDYSSVGDALSQSDMRHEATSVIRDGIEKFSLSGALRLKLINLLTDAEAVSDAISAALVAVTDSDCDIIELWCNALAWCIRHEPDRVERLYEAGCCRSASVARRLHALYLAWRAERATSGGGELDEVRRVFADMCARHPSALCSHQLYETMIELEHRHQQPADVAALRRLYRALVQHVPDCPVHLWLGYFRLEQQNGDSTAAAAVYDQALKRLSGEACDTFVAQLTLINNQVTID